jgi:quercetin dioxygenase-like cupin family protein
VTPLRSDIVQAQASHPRAFAERPGTIAHRSATPWENIVDLHKQTVDQGTVQRLIDQDVTGDSQCEFAVGIYRIEPHQLHPLHLHTSAAEFYFVVDGRARFTLGDEEIEGTPGTALYMPIGMPHAIQTDDSFVEVLYGFTPADITKLGTTFI